MPQFDLEQKLARSRLLADSRLAGIADYVNPVPQYGMLQWRPQIDVPDAQVDNVLVPIKTPIVVTEVTLYSSMCLADPTVVPTPSGINVLSLASGGPQEGIIEAGYYKGSALSNMPVAQGIPLGLTGYLKPSISTLTEIFGKPYIQTGITVPGALTKATDERHDILTGRWASLALQQWTSASTGNYPGPHDTMTRRIFTLLNDGDLIYVYHFANWNVDATMKCVISTRLMLEFYKVKRV